MPAAAVIRRVQALIGITGRKARVGVDSNAIKGLDLGSDTVLVEQPLYVDADTLKLYGRSR